MFTASQLCTRTFKSHWTITADNMAASLEESVVQEGNAAWFGKPNETLHITQREKEAVKLAQWMKCQPVKYEDLCSDPQPPHKNKKQQVCAYNPNTRKTKTDGLLLAS